MLLPFAIVFITLALIFYTMGVWGERLSGLLKKWHVITFWLGFICDTTGTTLMGKLAGMELTVNLHSVSGLAAIVLMAVHAVWATIVLLRGSQKSKESFHKFSLLVWLVWLIPYASGMFFGMTQ